MVFHHLQASFAGGEISPSLQARADAAAYSTWLKSAKNFYVHPQGGASNRPGTAFMGLAKNTGKPCRVVPFVLSEEESYVLELGEKYLRLYVKNCAGKGLIKVRVTGAYKDGAVAVPVENENN